MIRRLVLIVAAVVALCMAAVPPWRIGERWGPAPSERVEYGPVFAPPHRRSWFGDAQGRDSPAPRGQSRRWPSQVEWDQILYSVDPAWDLLAGQYAALLLATLFALRCLGRQGRRAGQRKAGACP